MPEPSKLEIACPAKVNLALSVGGSDPGGMHPIASWMVVLDFQDTLVLTALDSGPSRFELSYAPDAPRVEAIDWPLEKDLAYRAHRLLEAHCKRALPVTAVLAKRIPTGAGLGGGSSDAAGMLVGLNRLYRLGIPHDLLLDLARKLGSDVIFLTAALSGGQSSALVTGLGDQVRASRFKQAIHIVLIFPPHHSPTGPVYQAFDAIASEATADEERVRRLMNNTAFSTASLFNDLAEPTMRVTPALLEVRRQAAAALGVRVHVTGSGAAMFALAADRETAANFAQKIISKCGIPALPASTRFVE